MILSWVGLILGLGGILVGQMLEGGGRIESLAALIQPTAALIVFGGTLGATLLASTPKEFSGAIRAIPKVFFGGGHNFQTLIKEIVDIASLARKEGILSLEKKVKDIHNPFFEHNLRHIIDGYDPIVLKDMMETRIFTEEEEKMAIAKVFETGGGYSPTVGIIGAVLGLIHVMENLSDSSKLGAGIAVAFVATVYGVGIANLILLPIGSKVKKIFKAECEEMTLICDGLLGIQAGLNPRVIEDRLNNLLGQYTVEGQGAADGRKAA